jgi:hypothetical protein
MAFRSRSLLFRSAFRGRAETVPRVRGVIENERSQGQTVSGCRTDNVIQALTVSPGYTRCDHIINHTKIEDESPQAQAISDRRTDNVVQALPVSPGYTQCDDVINHTKIKDESSQAQAVSDRGTDNLVQALAVSPGYIGLCGRRPS